MAENIENNGCSQRDNAEHEGYVKAVSYTHLDVYKRQTLRKQKNICQCHQRLEIR